MVQLDSSALLLGSTVMSWFNCYVLDGGGGGGVGGGLHLYNNTLCPHDEDEDHVSLLGKGLSMGNQQVVANNQPCQWVINR